MRGLTGGGTHTVTRPAQIVCHPDNLNHRQFLIISKNRSNCTTESAKHCRLADVSCDCFSQTIFGGTVIHTRQWSESKDVWPENAFPRRSPQHRFRSP
jgi:hypothetical protein